MGRFLGFLILAAIIAALGYSANYLKPFPPWEGEPDTNGSNEETADGETSVIKAQGRLEPKEGTIAVSALPGEEIKQLLVEVGDSIAEGDQIAILGSQEIREAEYRLAEAERKKAKIQLESETQLSKEKVKAAELAVQLAEARQMEIPPAQLLEVLRQRKQAAESQLAALQRLRNNPTTRNAITDAELEQQSLLIDQLEAEIKHNEQKNEAAERAATLGINAAELDKDIAVLGRDSVEKSDPEEVLKWTEELAKRTLSATQVRAPSAGKVLEIYAREGERVANTPILLMADLDEMICVAEVHEASLKHIDIRPGSEDGALAPAKTYRATISSPALKANLSGEIVEVGRLIGAPKLREPNPLARSDRRTAEVKIELDPESRQAARRFVHLQVDVTIHLDED
jgi:HlyD family secretion protein